MLRYHCKKLPGVDLCPESYAEGRFPAGCTANDFVRIDQNDIQVPSLTISQGFMRWPLSERWLNCTAVPKLSAIEHKGVWSMSH